MVIKETSSGEKVYDLEFGARKVRLPGWTEPLTLVVVTDWVIIRDAAHEPKVTRSRKSQWRIVKSYLSRWRVEETIRFIKQSYRLEDIRLLKYERLRNLVMLVLVAAYFASVYLSKMGQVGDLGEPHPTGCKANLRRSRVPFLRHCRWDQAALVWPKHGNCTASTRS